MSAAARGSCSKHEWKNKLLHLIARVLNFILPRIPPGSPLQRKLLDNLLGQLPEVTYFRLRDLGFEPKGIVDIGAHVGDWSRSIRNIFPSAPITMIEAREEQGVHLRKACSELRDTMYVIALLGSRERETVEFQVHGTGSSMFSERSDVPRASRRLQTRTLDEIVEEDPRLRSPLFLKLDVQGAELEVLGGAVSTLLQAEVVQLEVQLLHYNEGAPSAAQVVGFMDQHGFAILDIAGFVRPNGVDLVQLDLVFARKDSRLRRDFFCYRQVPEQRT